LEGCVDDGKDDEDEDERSEAATVSTSEARKIQAGQNQDAAEGNATEH
jgi:hypothetical protein